MRPAFALLFSFLAAAGAGAGEWPPAVRTALSGFGQECRQAGETIDPEAMLTSVDLDGDGQPDWLIDTRRGCKAVRALSCTAQGACSLDIVLSRTGQRQASYKVLEHEVTPGHGLNVLRIVLAGAECGPAARCGRVLVWRNGILNLTR